MPERFELGTLPYELLAGTTAAVDFIAGLASDAADRRTRVVESMRAVEEHEDRLFERLLDGLRRIPGVAGTAPGAAHPDGVLLGRRPQGREVYEHLATAGVNAPASSFYAIEASRWLGLGDTGAVRAGLAPYTSPDDIERLLAGVAEVAR